MVCGVHRRTLDRLFKKSLGRTVSQEISRRRLMTARELLLTEDRPVADIAALVGFQTPQYFTYQFKKRFGLAPQRYRDTRRSKGRVNDSP